MQQRITDMGLSVSSDFIGMDLEVSRITQHYHFYNSQQSNINNCLHVFAAMGWRKTSNIVYMKISRSLHSTSTIIMVISMDLKNTGNCQPIQCSCLELYYFLLQSYTLVKLLLFILFCECCKSVVYFCYLLVMCIAQHARTCASHGCCPATKSTICNTCYWLFEIRIWNQRKSTILFKLCQPNCSKQ